VLSDLKSDLGGRRARRDRGLESVVDLRKRVVRELDVDNRTRDAGYTPDDRVV
jgi:hypothetical protein